jgi:hypothetical protein
LSHCHPVPLVRIVIFLLVADPESPMESDAAPILLLGLLLTFEPLINSRVFHRLHLNPKRDPSC